MTLYTAAIYDLGFIRGAFEYHNRLFGGNPVAWQKRADPGEIL